MTGSRMVKLAELWQRRSAKGTTYFSGFLGDVQILMFADGEITRPSGEVVRTWKLLIQEPDPNRRPQQSQKRAQQPRGDAVYDANYDAAPLLDRQRSAAARAGEAYVPQRERRVSCAATLAAISRATLLRRRTAPAGAGTASWSSPSRTRASASPSGSWCASSGRKLYGGRTEALNG